MKIFYIGFYDILHNGKVVRSIPLAATRKIDFVVNSENNRYYIQSALSVADEEKRQQEVNSLKRVPDSFKKIVIVKDDIIPWHDEDGIYYIGIEQFLLDESCINM